MLEGVYVSGGALEPMNIKDSILTGFGAGLLAVKGPEILTRAEKQDERLYREEEPEFVLSDGNLTTYLFYLGTENAGQAYSMNMSPPSSSRLRET